MRFSIFQDTDIGARESNQDRMGYCFSRESLLMVVADGMGGHLRGEVAAQLSIEAAAALFQVAAQPRLTDPESFLIDAFRAGHRALHRYRETHGLPECPRTTIVACVVQDNLAWWAHAGDSRLYLMRDAEVVTRTRDHSKVEALFSLGLITEAQAATHPERNKVLNCLGSPYDPTTEVQSEVRLMPGDAILLCSDGFWSGVDEAAMARSLNVEPAREVVPRLVREAVKQQGAGADNATAVALQWNAAVVTAEDPEGPSPELPDGAVTTSIATGADREARSAPLPPTVADPRGRPIS